MGFLPAIIVIIVIVAFVFILRSNQSSTSKSDSEPAWATFNNKDAREIGWEYCCLTIERTRNKNMVYVRLDTYSHSDEQTENLGEKNPKEAQVIRQELKNNGWQEVYEKTVNYINISYYKRPTDS